VRIAQDEEFARGLAEIEDFEVYLLQDFKALPTSEPGA
jgi:hypothetical protein